MTFSEEEINAYTRSFAALGGVRGALAHIRAIPSSAALNRELAAKKLEMIVIGHMGETLPFMLQRLDVMPMAMTKLKRPMSAYLAENVHYTFSGFNFTPTFLELLLHVGVDRLMFSADYPYSSMAKARAFLDQLPVSHADRTRIAHGNAETLLGL
jgi:predicted TIM-barrel fold metal-dependent hydrolase